MNRFFIFVLVFFLALGGGFAGPFVSFSWTGPSAVSAQDAADEDADEADADEEEDGEEDPEEEDAGAASAAEGGTKKAAESEEVAPAAPAENAGAGFTSKDFGKGGYISIWKILLAIILYLCWVFTTDWLSSDCQEHKLGVAQWVPIVYGSFLAGLLFFILIPYFWVGFFLLLAAYLAPMIVYILKRNAVVSDGEKVMTPAHLRYLAATNMDRFGVKMEAVAKDVHTTGPPIVLNPYGGTKTENEQRRIAARAHEGFRDARQLLADGLMQDAEVIIMDFAQSGVTIRYMVDGAWHNAPAIEREKADPALESLKILCGLDPADRRNKQEGRFKATFEYKYTFPEDRLKMKKIQDELERVPEDDVVKEKDLQRQLQVAKETRRPPETRTKDVTPKFVSQGTQTGERVLVQFETEKTVFRQPEELGMRDKTRDDVLAQLGRDKGLFIFAAPPASGMRTTMTVMLGKTDRYCREFVAIDDGVHKYEDVENVPVETCSAKTGDQWRQYLRNVYLKEPNVIVMRDIAFPDILDSFFEELRTDNRMMITSVRAKDGAEALLRMMMTKCNQKQFAENVNAVLTQRLVRRLCDHCKEPFQPAPQVLTQLGFPADRQVTFYRPPQDVEEGKECPECRAIGYRGRTALFELSVVGETTRKILATQPKLDLVRKALKKDGNRTMMEEGLLLVAKGVTSLQELKRALE